MSEWWQESMAHRSVRTMVSGAKGGWAMEGPSQGEEKASVDPPKRVSSR